MTPFKEQLSAKSWNLLAHLMPVTRFWLKSLTFWGFRYKLSELDVIHNSVAKPISVGLQTQDQLKCFLFVVQQCILSHFSVYPIYIQNLGNEWRVTFLFEIKITCMLIFCMNATFVYFFVALCKGSLPEILLIETL